MEMTRQVCFGCVQRLLSYGPKTLPVMKKSCHVSLWKTIHWPGFLLLLVLTVNNCSALSQEQCRSYFEVAEKFYYRNASLCKPTCEDHLLIQHGHGMLHKMKYIQSWFHNNAISESSCPFLNRGERTSNSSPVHGHTRKKRAVHDCTMPSIECDENYPFRTADGTCNNLDHPTWGMAEMPQRRLLAAAYDDGKSVPRTKGCGGNPLPSPRSVSNCVHRSGSKMLFHKRFTGMLVQFGQFLAHDLTLTGMASRKFNLIKENGYIYSRDKSGDSGEPLDCCAADVDHPECFSIKVPPGDDFLQEDCLPFSRSVFVDDCNGVRDQLNSQTAAIDVSQIYGVSEAEQLSLREPDTGRLLESDTNMLKIDETDTSCDVSATDVDSTKCFLSGDIRTNEQPGLASMHTLWMREHNRVVDNLAKLNPHWDGERLFQTGRKIIGAMMQHIVYNEWLPAVLGKDIMQKHGLELNYECQFADTYDPTVDLSIDNSFSTATLRFGHSMLHNMIGKVSDSFAPTALERLHDNFFKTKYVHVDKEYGPENILRWHCSTASPLSDRILENSVRNFLFPDQDNKTLDLASLNIQRGREHGLPSYNDYREYCGLPRAYHFGTGHFGLVDHEPEVANLLQKTYECPNDIDLWTGMMSERKECSYIMGPVQACLMVDQFKKLKDGDRFWYERNDTVTGFTLDQLNEIRKITMARVLCDCTHSVSVTRNVFWRQTLRSHFNRMHSCNDPRIPRIDLSKWKE